MNALIFGASGQDGYYLAELCKKYNISPILISRSTGSCIQADVANFAAVDSLLKQHTPAYIFHLAANSTTRLDVLFENHQTICTGSLNILEATRRHAPNARVFLTGSGLQFQNTGAPISETNIFNPSSPYSVSRIHSVYSGRYFRSLGMKVYVGYLFHHESPLRKPGHIAKVISSAVARISLGSTESLEIGDIRVKKEWTFAGDVMEGVWTLVNQDNLFESTIGSGIPYTIEQWLECCFSYIGKNWRDHVTSRQEYVAEYNCLLSDPSTIFSLGWRPKVALDELAAMMVEADVQSILQSNDFRDSLDIGNLGRH
jgi:GDPmannose 4,6-dehydratase